MELIAITAIIAVFLCALMCVWCYREGVKVGMGIKQNRKPEPIIKKKPEPVSPDEQAAIDKFYKGVDAIMGYDPYGVKNG